MTTMEFQAIEFESVCEALQYADAAGNCRAIICDGKYLVADESEIERIGAAGVEYALLSDYEMPDGSFRIMTVPVND
ncbi:MAG: hypothetical protein ACE5KM_09265 [Planctomycetaceae bacterium]